ncbi:MAG TPA: thioredoxin domain-containing protein, partial [Propionibacteriaceae bacterium]|nr:thioredoxin domain-containing protein [Propionibacteriaceae bacterium]
VVVWTDFQCPYCKPLELDYGPIFEELAASGDIALDIRVKSQVDQIILNDSSTRSAVAATCADTVGSFHDYFMTVFENQPDEGVGFTDAQLRGDFASKAGITGDDLTTFQSCFDTRSTLEWVTGVQTESQKQGITGTPVVEVNGTRFEPRAFAADKATILAEITKLAG